MLTPIPFFHWLIAPTPSLVCSTSSIVFFTMASQDVISQFSQDPPNIPPGQPDRSRTPRRHHQEGHQHFPTFRGPLHFATHQMRPGLPTNSVPPPPPPTWMNPANQMWMNTPMTQMTQQFPPIPPTMRQPLYDPTIHTPPRPTLTPRSPPSSSSPPGNTSIQHGYVGRPIDIPPVEQWKPDVEFHDTNKVNGLDFPSKIRQSRFTSYKDIEGMDPLQVPLWKFLYQGIHNTWLRRIAYGRETFVIPFDNIGTTVFIAELVAQLRSRNVDLDKLATYKSRSAGQFVNQKEATQNMAKEIAQLLQSWLPSHPPADQASQQRILELEAELAKIKSDNANSPPNASTPAHPASSPIGRAFQGQASASTNFDPATLLVSPGSVDPWLVANQPDSLTETQYKRWLKDLKLPQHQLDTLNKQLEKVKEWWQNQPDDAVKTVQRASVAMGIDPGKHKNATSDEIVLRVMTVAMLMHS